MKALCNARVTSSYHRRVVVIKALLCLLGDMGDNIHCMLLPWIIIIIMFTISNRGDKAALTRLILCCKRQNLLSF